MLEGRQVALRAVEPADLEILRRWRNQPHFRRNFREYREISSLEQRQWYDSQVVGNPSVRMFAIVDRKTGSLLGACGLCCIDWLRRSADFSIYIGADDRYIDAEYADDAAKVLMAYGFEELGLHRLWAEVYAFDSKKQAMFRRLGFRVDGRFRESHWAEGRWHDSLFYALLQPEFKKSRKIANDKPVKGKSAKGKRRLA